MTRKQLECFMKTAELLSISKAAKELYISQPALSQQIQKLEQELGVTLFIRTNKALQLTIPGKVLVNETEEYFAKEQELREAVRTAGLISERVLRICFLPGPFAKILPEIVKKFRQKHPEYNVELYDEDWNTMTNEMTSLNFDIAFYLRLSDCKFPNTQYRDLVTSDCFYMMSKNHPLATKSSLTFDDIEYEIFCVDIKPEKHNNKYISLYEIFDAHNRKPNVLLAKSIDASLMVIRSSMAIGVASPEFLGPAANDLCFIPSDELPKASLSVIWSNNNDNPAVNDFIKVLEEM